MSVARLQVLPLYLIEILHQTTTRSFVCRPQGLLYLIEILHQTTTGCGSGTDVYCCILSKFYIKPQRAASACAFAIVVSYRNSTSNHNSLSRRIRFRRVVSYRNSTSNHNNNFTGDQYSMLYLIEILHQTTTTFAVTILGEKLYLIEILHQTTTLEMVIPLLVLLYLIEILHQTTTTRLSRCPLIGCILSKFYIKPQLISGAN